MPRPLLSSLPFGPKVPTRRRASVLAMAVLFIFFAGSIAILAREALLQVRGLAGSNAGNLQWALSQTEVELLQLHSAVFFATTQARPDLAPVRRWFDILVSRIEIIRDGPVYAKLTAEPDILATFGRLDTFLTTTLPYIDGPDADLRANLPNLVAQTRTLQTDVRSIALAGITLFSTESDAQRRSTSNTLTRIVLLTAALLFLLLFAIFFLARMYHTTCRSARENQSTRDRLHAMLTTSLDAVFVVNGDGRIIEFNGAASSIFGYSQKKAYGKDIAKLLPATDIIAAHNAAMQQHEHAEITGAPGGVRIQMQAKRSTGAVFPAELSIAKTASPEGEIFVCFLRDKSERKLAEERATKARDEALAGERAKARFMAVMSHEMRTPLNGLLGSLDLLKGTNLSPKQTEMADVMQKSGEMLLHHVNDVLDIARLESGRMIGDHLPLNLDMLVQDVLESQSALAQAKGLILRYRPEIGPVGTIMGSAIGLRQVLLNLVANAIKFTAQGLVEVQASVIETGAGEGSEPRLSLRVRDTGIGIAQGDQTRIFEDFVTLDSSFGRRADGSGLGLGIARRIVYAMGGDIGVVSQPKLGATFWIDLPYQQSAQPAAAAAAAATSQAAQKRNVASAQDAGPPLDILVVEDNQVNRFVICEMLTGQGHRVREAADGIEGVTLAQQHQFDLILMDISMPALDGIAATVRLRAGNGPCAHTPIVALTAHAMPEDRALFLASGMNAVLSKPLDKTALLQVLAEITLPPARRSAQGVKKRPSPRTPRPQSVAVQTAARAAATNAGKGLPIVRAGALNDLKSAVGPARLSSLTARFAAEGDAAMARSAEALTHGQMAEAQALLHDLAGAAATFGALALQAHLAQMETDLKSKNGQAAQALHPELGVLWRRTKAEVTRQMAA